MRDEGNPLRGRKTEWVYAGEPVVDELAGDGSGGLGAEAAVFNQYGKRYARVPGWRKGNEKRVIVVLPC